MEFIATVQNNNRGIIQVCQDREIIFCHKSLLHKISLKAIVMFEFLIEAFCK